MLWTPWPTSVPTVLFVCALLAWWFIEPKTAHLNLIVVIGCVLFYWAVAPELAQATPYQIYQFSVHAAKLLRLDVLVLYHANMLVTGLAVVWYVYFDVAPSGAVMCTLQPATSHSLVSLTPIAAS